MTDEHHPESPEASLDDSAFLAEVLPHLQTVVEHIREMGLIGHAGPLGKLATSIEARLGQSEPAPTAATDPTIVAGKEIKPTSHHYLTKQLRESELSNRFGLH